VFREQRAGAAGLARHRPEVRAPTKTARSRSGPSRRETSTRSRSGRGGTPRVTPVRCGGETYFTPWTRNSRISTGNLVGTRPHEAHLRRVLDQEGPIRWSGGARRIVAVELIARAVVLVLVEHGELAHSANDRALPSVERRHADAPERRPLEGCSTTPRRRSRTGPCHPRARCPRHAPVT
jgi:hypothetical protein